MSLNESVSLIALVYVRARRKMLESENGAYDYPFYILNDCQKIVHHIDAVIESMDEKSRLILENEVKKGRKGEWYLEYCSTTTYYRIREEVYQAFIEELNK